MFTVGMLVIWTMILKVAGNMGVWNRKTRQGDHERGLRLAEMLGWDAAGRGRSDFLWKKFRDLVNIYILGMDISFSF